MEEISVITLEDGIGYVIVDEIIINNTKYVYLADEENPLNFCIRKVIIENNEEYLINLDNELEFEKALQKYNEKNHKN